MTDQREIHTCDLCGKTYNRKGDLGRHIRIHSGVRPYKCDVCAASFVQRSALTTHMNTHTGDRPYLCGIGKCTASFGDPSSRTRHRKETHQGLVGYKCPHPKCTSRIKRKSAFRLHISKDCRHLKAARQLVKLDDIDVEVFAVGGESRSKRGVSQGTSEDSCTGSEASWSPVSVTSDDEFAISGSSSPMVHPYMPAGDAPPAYNSCAPIGGLPYGALSPLREIPSLPESPNALHLNTTSNADAMMYNGAPLWDDHTIPQFIQPDVFYHPSAGMPSLATHYDDFGLHDSSFGMPESQDPYMIDENYLSVAWSATY